MKKQSYLGYLFFLILLFNSCKKQDEQIFQYEEDKTDYNSSVNEIITSFNRVDSSINKKELYVFYSKLVKNNFNIVAGNYNQFPATDMLIHQHNIYDIYVNVKDTIIIYKIIKQPYFALTNEHELIYSPTDTMFLSHYNDTIKCRLDKNWYYKFSSYSID